MTDAKRVFHYAPGTPPAHLVLPGDILLVRNLGTAAVTRLTRLGIRIGSWLSGRPTQWTHVILAHHVDDAGTFWGIEGRPGAVGWVDLDPHLADPVTLTNARQPKNDAGRALIVDAGSAMVGKTMYDWTTIAVDAANAIAAAEHIRPLWRMTDHWGPGVPGHVVCSALADWAYEQAGLETPDADRYCTPGDWAALIEAKGWSG